jgi:TPR repeat protein
MIGLAVLALPLSACQLCDFYARPMIDAIRWSTVKPKESKESKVPQEPECCNDAYTPPELEAEGYRKAGGLKAGGPPPIPNLATCNELAVTEIDRLFCQAEAGQVSAMEEIADRYQGGRGVPRVYARSVLFYEKAAKAGSPYAQFMLSIMYAEGRGVRIDLAKSVEWFERASKNPGSNLAQFRVAKRYVRGYGLPQDDEKAVYWYQLAADNAFAPAQIEMGDAFYQGRGRSQDYEQAFDWYLLAAEQNHPYAEAMVGLMLLEGQGVEVNFPDAVMWTQKAAYQGARQAQYRLGRLYFYGIGVRQNDAKAYAWWKLALKDVDEDEPTELKMVIERMRPETRAHAVKLAKEFTKKYQKPEGLSKI